MSFYVCPEAGIHFPKKEKSYPHSAAHVLLDTSDWSKIQ